MFKKHLLLLLLLALIAPWAAKAQQPLLTENFDNMSGISNTFSATGWYAYNAGSGNNWTLISGAGVGSSKCARYPYSSTNAADCYLVSAPFNVSSSFTELGLSLYELTGGWGSETFEAFFVKASDVTDGPSTATATKYIAIASANYSNTDAYAEATGSNSNSALAGQFVRLIVHCTSAADINFLNIDDITVTQTSTEPYVTLSPATETVFVGLTKTLTATYGNVTGTPNITYTSNNESVATVSGNGTTTATVTGVAAGIATITVTLNYQGTDYTATCEVTVEEPSYCTPHISYTSDYIKSFVTTGGDSNISNTNTGQGTGGYSNFYNTHFVSAMPETEIGFSVVRGYTDTYNYAIWVDWNKDYEFDNTTERVAVASSVGDWSGSFTIPAATAAGDYRMRVLQVYSYSPTPCVSASYGEGEDYKLTVLQASDCEKPETLEYTVVSVDPGQVNLTWTGGSGQYNVEYKLASDENWTGYMANTTATSCTLENLVIGSAYQARVQSICGNETSGWKTVDFTMPYCMPADMCEISYELSGGYYYSYYSYYYGWYGAYISVIDVETNQVLTTLTNEVYGQTTTGTLSVCDGRQIRFAWTPSVYESYFDDQCAFTILDVNGEEILSGTSGFSNPITYTVNCEEVTCFKPTHIEVEPSYTTAEISWQGSSDSYNVRYRTIPVIFYDGFEYGLDQWTTYHFGDENENTYWHTTPGSNFDNGAHYGENVAISRSYYAGAYTVDNWLITPQVTLEGTLKFWVTGSSYYPEHYAVYVSTTGNAVEDFGDEPFYEPPTITDNWVEIVVDLSQFNGAQGYIALRNNDYNQDYILIDDFGIYGDESAAGPWVNRSTDANETSIELDGLEMNTFYEYQLQGVCGNETSNWTNAAAFMTLNGNEKQFLTEGLWNVDANWMPEGVPTANQNVHIKAAATIPADCVAEANAVTMETGGSLLIKDGGQLQFESGDVVATMEKEILGYGTNEDKWQLISAFGGSMNPADVQNMLTGEYDLYRFDGTEALEWRNYETESFNMLAGLGYLYANKQNTTLRFVSTLLKPAYYYAGASGDYYLTNTTDALGTFNLLGNLYARNGYLMYLTNGVRTDITNFYVMNEAGTELVPNTVPYLKPMQGAFVQATADNQRVLIAVQPWSRMEGSSPVLSMAVSQGNTSVDQALLRFGQGNNLEKFQLNPSHTKLYMPVENKDCAVVYSEEMGEQPVCFKAEKNGSYTIGFNTEEVSFSYLHLIDNMTGADVDLLATPSYSFEARTTDYASRFKLVFATGDNADGNFAFFSDGSFVINNEGNATLQVIDVTGRVIKSESINGCANVSVNAATGVYMLRLINGNDVKVQKVIVR